MQCIRYCSLFSDSLFTVNYLVQSERKTLCLLKHFSCEPILDVKYIKQKVTCFAYKFTGKRRNCTTMTSSGAYTSNLNLKTPTYEV